MVKKSTIILKEIEKLTIALKKANKEENSWMRDLKHDDPSPTIKTLMIKLYKFGFYLPYTHLRTIEMWLDYGKPLDPAFYFMCVDNKIWKSHQTARNSIVALKRMGISVKSNKLNIIQVEKINMRF